MEQQFHQGQALLQHIHSNLGRLEQTLSEAEAQPYFKEISSQTSELAEKCTELDRRLGKESLEKRRAWKFRVDQLKYDFQCASASFNALQLRLTNKFRAVHERNELLTQRIRPAETAVHLEDQELLYNDRLKGAHRGVDDLLGNAENVLAALKSQHWNLKGIRRTLTGFGQTLGLSQTTLSLIERRVSEDKLVFCVGAVFVLLFMYAFYSFWTR